MTRTILTNAVIDPAAGPTDITIEDGRIAAIGPASGTAQVADVEDVGGALVVPGFVDGHNHADKSMWGQPWSRRTSQPITMDQMFEDTLHQWANETAQVGERAGIFLRKCIAYGSTSIRAFADVAPEIGLSGVEAMLALREELAGAADLTVVAFPQLGVLRKPGTQELLEEALKAGADWIGGLDPAGVDGDALAQLDILFRLAEKYQVSIDIHMHEDGELGFWLIRRIADRVKAHGMQGKVGLCDVFCITDPTESELDTIAGVLAEADISVAVGVHGLLPVPDVQRLHRLGVRMCMGSDSARSQWSPWGEGDMLMRAMMMSYKRYWRRDEDLEFALRLTTDLGRIGLSLPPAGLTVGSPADLVVVGGEALAEIVVQPPATRALVLKAGKVVARNGEFLG